jgi:hypothetical protein
MMSLTIANDMKLHKIDTEQAFLQADKLEGGVNGRYFINPPPGSSVSKFLQYPDTTSPD